MPRFEAFAGIRYDLERVDLAEVTAPPYDVIDAETRAALAERHPSNVVRVDCPTPAEGHYDGAATTFRHWRDSGVLVDEAGPVLYIYRMAFTDDHGRTRHTTGVLGAVGLEPHGQGDVLAHEHTTPRARSDRLQLLRVTRANLSPIWFLSLAVALTELLDPGHQPVAAWVDDAGIRHTFWRVDEPDVIDAVAGRVASAPLVIADGHHRYETCLAYQHERREQAGGAPGAYDLTLGFVVELIEDELDIEPIHRVVSGLPADFDLLAPLAEAFEVGSPEPAEPSVLDRMDKEDALAVVMPSGVRLLRPRSGGFADPGRLDTSRVDAVLASLPAHDVAYQPGVTGVLAAIAGGSAQAAVLVRPPAIADIAATARRRERMPTKTTYFWPKPRTGLVFRALD